MPNSQSMHLVVGSDSLIGNALMKYLEYTGVRAVGTTRRKEKVDDRHFFLDLSHDISHWRCPFPVAVATVCAGVTSTETCRCFPEASFRVNVENTLQLIRSLLEHGAYVLYLSSSRVFDGSHPLCADDEPTCPVSAYGRQKAEVEKELRHYNGLVCIVRFTKVWGARPSLIENWICALQNHQIIRPFSDTSVSPIPLNTAVTVLKLLADIRFRGVVQVSAETDVTYEEVARYGAKLMGFELELIQPVTSAGALPEPMPRYTSLDTQSLKAELGITPPSAWWTIAAAFSNPSALANCIIKGRHQHLSPVMLDKPLRTPPE